MVRARWRGGSARVLQLRYSPGPHRSRSFPLLFLCTNSEHRLARTGHDVTRTTVGSTIRGYARALLKQGFLETYSPKDAPEQEPKSLLQNMRLFGTSTGREFYFRVTTPEQRAKIKSLEDLRLFDLDHIIPLFAYGALVLPGVAPSATLRQGWCKAVLVEVVALRAANNVGASILPLQILCAPPAPRLATVWR